MYHPGPRPASAREMRRRVRDAVRSGSRSFGGAMAAQNAAATAVRQSMQKSGEREEQRRSHRRRPQSAAGAARSSIEPIVRTETQIRRKQRQRMFRREMVWQKNQPYKPPLQQCIAADRLVFKKSEFEDGPSTESDNNNSGQEPQVDFQTGNFGTEFDKVRQMRMKAAAQANALWRSTDRGRRKWSPDGERIGVDGEAVMERGGAGESEKETSAEEKPDTTAGFSVRASKNDTEMLKRLKKSSRQVHGYFRPSSATRCVQGSWGSKALDLQGLSQELPGDCMEGLRGQAMVDEAKVMEKIVRNLKFDPRVVNQRAPGAGRLRVNVDYMMNEPEEASRLYAKR